MAAKQNRRVLSGIITGLLTLYAVGGILVPFFAWFVPWTAPLIEGASLLLMPVVLVGMVISMLIPLVIIVVGAMALHWYLCKLMKAPIDF